MTEAEEWRPVAGFPDYEVSNLGRVLSHKGGVAHLLKPFDKRGGYLEVNLCRDSIKHRHSLHGLVAEAFHGPRPAGAWVLHNDGDPKNNIASNLRFGSPSENCYDAVRHGVHPMAKKTHCVNGHAFDEVNTQLYRGVRLCRPCKRATRARYEERRMFAAANVTLRESA